MSYLPPVTMKSRSWVGAMFATISTKPCPSLSLNENVALLNIITTGSAGKQSHHTILYRMPKYWQWVYLLVTPQLGTLPDHTLFSQVLVGSPIIVPTSHMYMATVPYGRPLISEKNSKSYEMDPPEKSGRSGQAPIIRGWAIYSNLDHYHTRPVM